MDGGPPRRRGRHCGAAFTATPRSRARRTVSRAARRQAGAHAGRAAYWPRRRWRWRGDRRGMGGPARGDRPSDNAADAAGQCDHRRRRRCAAPVAAEIEKYLASDLLFYRATGPQGLRERQAQHWDPILAWARDALGARFQGRARASSTSPSPKRRSRRPAAAIPTDPWRLGAVHVVTTLTGSALIALALLRGRLTAEAAWQAAHVDEDWNMEQWGSDEVALERRAFRFAEFQAAATVLRSAASGLSVRRAFPSAQSSAAGDAHVARQRRALVTAVDNEIVALGLAARSPRRWRRTADRCLRRRATACAGRRRLPGRGTCRACRCRSPARDCRIRRNCA